MVIARILAREPISLSKRAELVSPSIFSYTMSKHLSTVHAGKGSADSDRIEHRSRAQQSSYEYSQSPTITARLSQLFVSHKLDFHAERASSSRTSTAAASMCMQPNTVAPARHPMNGKDFLWYRYECSPRHPPHNYARPPLLPPRPALRYPVATVAPYPHSLFRTTLALLRFTIPKYGAPTSA